MLASCRALRIDVGKTAGELCQITLDLLARDSRCQDSYVRPLAYKLRLLPGTPPGVQLTGVSDALSVSVFRMGSYGDRRGIQCAISPWRRPPDNVIPVRAKITGGYVNSALALDDARRAGYADAILLTTDGWVAEATTSNVFAVRHGVLVTPPTSTGLLEGITRDTILTLAAEELGVRCLVADLGPDDLFAADEVFLTGTGCEIVPVTGIDGRPVAAGAPGPLTRGLAGAYAAAVRGRADSRPGWLLPVPSETSAAIA
jgi:branched-chain amino acid aminotransferase